MWNTLLAVDEHEEGEPRDPERCPNCRAEELAGRLTEFEMFCWGWAWTNVTRFALAGGLLPGLVRDTGLRGPAKELFIRAQAAIFAMRERIQNERAQAEAEDRRSEVGSG